MRIQNENNVWEKQVNKKNLDMNIHKSMIISDGIYQTNKSYL